MPFCESTSSDRELCPAQAKLNVGITGAMPSDLKAQLMTDLTALPVGDEKRLTIAKAPVLKGHHATIVEKNAKSTAVSFGFPIDTIRSDKDWAALWLVRSYFGEHRSSNSYLYQQIRQARGMNYGDYSYIEYFPRGMYQTKPDANLGRSSQIFQDGYVLYVQIMMLISQPVQPCMN